MLFNITVLLFSYLVLIFFPIHQLTEVLIGAKEKTHVVLSLH